MNHQLPESRAGREKERRGLPVEACWETKRRQKKCLSTRAISRPLFLAIRSPFWPYPFVPTFRGGWKRSNFPGFLGITEHRVTKERRKKTGRWEESNADGGSKREGALVDIFFDKTDCDELFNRDNQDRVAIANHCAAEWATFLRTGLDEFSHSDPLLLFGHLYFHRAPNDCRLATTNSMMTLVN